MQKSQISRNFINHTMESKMSVYDLGSYKYSDPFSRIDSEVSFKSLAFIEFLEEGESLVVAKQEKLDAQLNKLYNQNEEEGQIFEQQDHYIGSEINNTLQESLLLAATGYLYSQFEYLLIEIAKKIGAMFNSSIDINEYVPKIRKNKSLISKALDYIQENSKINNIEDEWGEIKKFQMIRNCLVHANGVIKSNYTGLDIYVKEHNSLVYEKSINQIKVTKEYLLEMRKTCFDFLQKIMEKAWENRPK